MRLVVFVSGDPPVLLLASQAGSFGPLMEDC